MAAGGAKRNKHSLALHPVSVRRFPSFRTQPLENFSRYLWTHGFLSNPAPGENLVSGNLVMETGCVHCSCNHKSLQNLCYDLFRTTRLTKQPVATVTYRGIATPRLEAPTTDCTCTSVCRHLHRSEERERDWERERERERDRVRERERGREGRRGRGRGREGEMRWLQSAGDTSDDRRRCRPPDSVFVSTCNTLVYVSLTWICVTY